MPSPKSSSVCEIESMEVLIDPLSSLSSPSKMKSSSESSYPDEAKCSSELDAECPIAASK
jgi:hypothetical protein